MAPATRCRLRIEGWLCLTQRALDADSGGMNSSTHPHPIARPITAPSSPRQVLASPAQRLLRLPPAPVQQLECPARGRVELTVRQGCIWLTCEGRPEDVFLATGEAWSVSGAARLHFNAENGQDALLEIRVRGG